MEHQTAEAVIHHNGHHTAGALLGPQFRDSGFRRTAAAAFQVQIVVEFHTAHGTGAEITAAQLAAPLGVGGDQHTGLHLPVSGQQALRIGDENAAVVIQILHLHLGNVAVIFHAGANHPVHQLHLPLGVEGAHGHGRDAVTAVDQLTQRGALGIAGTDSLAQFPGKPDQGLFTGIIAVGIVAVHTGKNADTNTAFPADGAALYAGGADIQNGLAIILAKNL